MVDEIELLRQFRSDVPEPSSEARVRAWAAVVAADSEAEKATATSRGHDGPRPPRLAWGKWLAALAAAATVAILAVELSSAGGPPASVVPPSPRGKRADRPVGQSPRPRL